jgi:hypothetical protein
LRMAWQQVFKPRTRGWGKAKAALEDYIHEVEAEQKAVIDGKGAAPQTRVPMREAAE